jgi:hypothetical protein
VGVADWYSNSKGEADVEGPGGSNALSAAGERDQILPSDTLAAVT